MQDLEELRSSRKNFKPEVFSKESKAISSAMKALQERIKTLESKNALLVQELESKKTQEINLESLKTKEEQLEYYESSAKHYYWRSKELQESNQQLVTKVQELQNQIKKLQRTNESSLKEKENLQKDIEQQQQHYKSQLAELKDNVQKAQSSEAKVSQELKTIREQVSATNDKLLEANTHIEYLGSQINETEEYYENQISEYQRKLESCQSRIQDSSKKTEQKLLDLQNQSTDHKKLVYEKDQKLSQLEKEVNTLRNANKILEEANLTLKRQYEQSQAFAKDVVSVNEQLVKTFKKEEKLQTSQVKKKPKTTRASRTKTFKFGQDPEAEDYTSIENLENEIVDLNNHYKELLNSGPEKFSSISALRNQLNLIAGEMETKSAELHSLKRQRQNRLRSKIMSFSYTDFEFGQRRRNCHFLGNRPFESGVVDPVFLRRNERVCVPFGFSVRSLHHRESGLIGLEVTFVT